MFTKVKIIERTQQKKRQHEVNMTFQLIDTLKVHQRKTNKSIEDDEDEDTNLLFSRMKKRGKTLLHSDKRKAVYSRN